jgi:hypothetical protein
MTHLITDITGRGFHGALPPEISVSLQSYDDQPNRALKGQSRTIPCFQRPIRNAIGDLSWNLRESSIMWPMNAELEIELLQIGTIRMRLDSDDLEAVQEWCPIGESENFQVQLVLRQVPSHQDEKIRRQRLLRIQRRQFELELLRSVPASKLFAWEAKRADRAAKIIQSAWRSVVHYTKVESKLTILQEGDEGGVNRRNALPLYRYLSIISDDSDTEMGEQTKHTEKLPKDNNVDSKDMVRMQQLNDKTMAMARESVAESYLGSLQNIYQKIIEEEKEINQRRCELKRIQHHRKSRARRCTRSLSNLNSILEKLSNHLGEPLPSQASTASDEERKSTIKRIKDLWRISKSIDIQRKALNAHVAALGEEGENKDWWRVHIYDQECDIREKKASSPPWRYPIRVESELRDESRELSRWWVAFASKSPTKASLIVDKYKDEQTEGNDTFIEKVNREKDKLVRELDARRKLSVSPFLTMMMSCPPHRLRDVNIAFTSSMAKKLSNQRSSCEAPGPDIRPYDIAKVQHQPIDVLEKW